MAAFGGYGQGYVALTDLDLHIIETAKKFLDPSIQSRLIALFNKLGIPHPLFEFKHHSDLLHDIKYQ